MNTYRIEGLIKNRDGTYAEIVRNYEAENGYEANMLALKEGIINSEVRLLEIIVKKNESSM